MFVVFVVFVVNDKCVVDFMCVVLLWQNVPNRSLGTMLIRNGRKELILRDNTILSPIASNYVWYLHHVFLRLLGHMTFPRARCYSLVYGQDEQSHQ